MSDPDFDPTAVAGAPIPVASMEGEGATYSEQLAPPLSADVDTSDALMSKDNFFKMFYGAHAGAAVACAMAGGPTLRSLAHAKDVAGAREASDVLYDTCAELPWMNWTLRKSGKWMQRATMIGLYGFNLATAISVELDEHRRAARPSQSPTGEAGS